MSHFRGAAGPNLATLELPPSWVNLAGRVDRAACLELRASEVRHDATFKTARTCRKPGRRVAKARVCREAVGTITISVFDLLDIHNRRKPRLLSGDYRTAKANAMRYTPGKPPSHPDQRATQRRPGRDHGLTPNPNKGVSRNKMLGLDELWTQTLTLERWRLHERLAYHFLICPGCNEKYKKLFLPLCTEAELRDADVALTWPQCNEPRIRQNASLKAQASTLMDRYGLLFGPRRLLCRHCLGIRYGTGMRHKRSGQCSVASAQLRQPVGNPIIGPNRTIPRDHAATWRRAAAAHRKARKIFQTLNTLRQQLDDL